MLKGTALKPRRRGKMEVIVAIAIRDRSKVQLKKLRGE